MALKIAIFGPFGVMYFLFVLFEKTCSSEQLLDELVSDLNHLINRCGIEATRRFVLDHCQQTIACHNKISQNTHS